MKRSLYWILILCAIFIIFHALDYCQSSKEIQKLPDNAVKALNVYLENVQEKDSIK